MPALRLSVIAIALSLLLTGCSDSSTPPQTQDAAAESAAPASPDAHPAAAEPAFDLGDPTGSATQYRCDDGTELELTLYQHGVSLQIGEQSEQLQQAPAASGSFYKGAQWSVHIKDGAMLLINSASTQGCFARSDSTLPSIEIDDDAESGEAY